VTDIEFGPGPDTDALVELLRETSYLFSDNGDTDQSELEANPFHDAGEHADRVSRAGSWYLDAADLLAEPDPGPTAWLVEGLIVDGAIVAAVGRWKTTKSYGLLDLCISIATGRPAFGTLAIPRAGVVVFVNEESGRAALWRRLDALCRGRAIDPDELRDRLYVAPNAGVKLDDPHWQNELVDVGRELHPRLFVFDPLARMKDAGRDENAQREMAVAIEFLRELRDQTGAAVAFVHHLGHVGSSMRGSSDLETVWETRLSWERDGQAPIVAIEAEHREAESGDPINYRIAWDSLTRSMRFELVEEPPGYAARDLIAEMTEWLTANPRSTGNAVAKGIRANKRTVQELLATSGHFEYEPGPNSSKKWVTCGSGNHQSHLIPPESAGGDSEPPLSVGEGLGKSPAPPVGPASDFTPIDENEVERLAALARETFLGEGGQP
jgi:hypothetical protein